MVVIQNQVVLHIEGGHVVFYLIGNELGKLSEGRRFEDLEAEEGLVLLDFVALVVQESVHQSEGIMKFQSPRTQVLKLKQAPPHLLVLSVLKDYFLVVAN